jgi:hypothetical protein
VTRFLFQVEGRLKVDWPAIRPADDVVLVSTPSGAAKHRESDRTGHEVLVVDHLDADVIERLVAERISGPADAQDCRLATLEEELLPALARVRERLDLPGPRPDFARRYSDKIAMKETLREHGVRLPRFRPIPADAVPPRYEELVQALGSPVFIKPTSSAGSHGTALIDDHTGWQSWLDRRESGVTYEADEYLTGRLYHVDTVVRFGAPAMVFVGQYTVPNAEFLSGRILGSRPVDPDEDGYQDLVALNATSLRALGTWEGVYHLEAFRAGDGEVTFLEVAARPAGAMVPDLYAAVYGVSLPTLGVLTQWSARVAELAESSFTAPDRTAHAVWAWVPPRAGVVRKTQDPVWGTALGIDVTWRCGTGDTLAPPDVIVARVGNILARLPSRESELGFLDYLSEKYEPLVMERSQG